MSALDKLNDRVAKRREFVAELETMAPRSSLCRLCGHGILWQAGCWQSAEHGYACPAADPTDDRHQTAVVDGHEVVDRLLQSAAPDYRDQLVLDRATARTVASEPSSSPTVGAERE